MNGLIRATESIISMLMAKGKFRGSNGTNKTAVSTNGIFKGADVFTTEFEINETPPSARTLLTKGYIQDEINTFSGATVSTRGRFMTEQEKGRCPNERPLYLYIQGHTKHNIDLAIQKINEIIKTEHQSSLNRPSRFTNAPPPLMSLHTGVPSVEKICVGIENAPQGFDLRGRIIGAGGANLLYIRGETGATVTLRGRGSQFMDPVLGAESPEPLHLYIEHPKPDALQNAKQLAINLIQTMQSELQSYIQQQPPPVQPQQVLETQPIQQIQQAHFQTMNIGALAQSNVVTIQHQDIIQHPQSSVVTLPATILTATMAGGPASGSAVPPPSVHIPAHAGPMVPSSQSQTLISTPPPVGQVQLIGPPPAVSQVQYQIHSGQPVHIQGIQMPTVSHSSAQPVAQMYVMSQPPPQSPGQHGFISSSSAPVSGAVSYVYTQPNIQRSVTPSDTIETVNLQQPPPLTPLNITHQPPPPLLHLHFPPPNFPPNQPPPPIPQTYQIQYQQVQTTGHQAQTQFVLQSEESIVPPPFAQNSEHAQHILQPQFEGQPPPQYPLQVPPPPPPPPPPSTQTFLVPNSQESHPHPHPHHPHHPHPHHHHHHHHHHQQQQQPLFPMGDEGLHQHDGPIEQGPPPQPVPPPQMVPPPAVNHMQNSMNILTNMPPPNQQHPPQNAPWLYQGQQPPGMPPPQNLHNVPPSQVPQHIQYHTPQLHYHNGQMQAQVHYTIESPPQQHFDMHKPDSPENQKGHHHGVKRRFADIEGPQEPPPYHCGPPPSQRHGNGEGERHQQHMHGPSPGGVGHPHGDRNKPLMPSPHPGEKHNIEQRPVGPNSGNEQNFGGDCGPIPGPPPPAPWQAHHVRVPWVRPPPAPREGEHHVLYPVPPLPPNMPPPQIRPRGQLDIDRGRSPVQGATLEHHMNMECNQQPPYSVKPPPYNSIPLISSICNAPPPPPPPPPPPSSPHHHHHHHHQHHRSQYPPQQYQAPVSQAFQPPVSGPPWMN